MDLLTHFLLSFDIRAVIFRCPSKSREKKEGEEAKP